MNAHIKPLSFHIYLRTHTHIVKFSILHIKTLLASKQGLVTKAFSTLEGQWPERGAGLERSLALQPAWADPGLCCLGRCSAMALLPIYSTACAEITCALMKQELVPSTSTRIITPLWAIMPSSPATLAVCLLLFPNTLQDPSWHFSVP